MAETSRITFRLYGFKHTLVADTQAVRDGWFKAFKKHITLAKEVKEFITSSSSFKKTYYKLSTFSMPLLVPSNHLSPAVSCYSGRVYPEEEHRLQF